MGDPVHLCIWQNVLSQIDGHPNMTVFHFWTRLSWFKRCERICFESKGLKMFLKSSQPLFNKEFTELLSQNF